MTTKRYNHLSPSARRRRRTVQLLWTAVSAVPLLTVYYLAPLDGPLDISTLIGFVLGLVAFALVIVWQVRAIVSSDAPRLRTVRAVVIGVSTLLVVFAATYSVISNSRPDSFTEPLSRTDALYFTLTVFATVGFGDIAPRTDVARIITMVQMITGLIAVGLLGKIVFAAMQKGLRRQEDERAAEIDDQAGGGERPTAPTPAGHEHTRPAHPPRMRKGTTSTATIVRARHPRHFRRHQMSLPAQAARSDDALAPPRPAHRSDPAPWMTGMTTFAGVMLIITGAFNVIQGLVALFQNEVYVAGREYVFASI